MTIAQQIGNLNHDLDVRSKAADFIRVAQAIAVGGTLSAAADHAKAAGFSARTVEILRKAVVDPLGMSAALSESGLISAFVDSMRNNAFDAVLPFCIRTPMKTSVTLITLSASGSKVAENQIKKISSLELDGNMLDPLKATCIIVLSEELARSVAPGSFQLFAAALRGGVSIETDREFLRILTDGISATPSSGVTEAAVRNDLRVLLTGVSTGSASQLFLITTSTIAKQVAIISDDNSFPDTKWNGGSIAGIPIIVSDACASGELILVDAAGIAADSADFELASARHATLDLNDDPDSPPSGTTVLTSLWSHNLTAVRVERYFAAQRLRTSAVAVISGVDFDGDSP